MVEVLAEPLESLVSHPIVLQLFLQARVPYPVEGLRQVKETGEDMMVRVQIAGDVMYKPCELQFCTIALAETRLFHRKELFYVAVESHVHESLL